MTAENLDKWLAMLESQEVQVGMPRFEFESSFAMKEALQSLGLVHALSSKPGEADFSGMNGRRDYISATCCTRRGSGNERGTEAAAATAVEMFGCPSEPAKTGRVPR